MKIRYYLISLALSLVTATSHAGLISVTGPNSNIGVSASIISAPTDVSDDAAYNQAQQGFNEQQGYTLTSALAIDGGSVSAGTTVDSHMIFLNSGPGHNTTLIEHFNVNWTFSGNILGVMSSYNGSLEIASSAFLGAAGTIYPGSTFAARGLENLAGCNMNVNDCYGFSGNTLNLTMRVTEPGDWIRVITQSPTSVPEPTTALLMSLGLAAFGFSAMRRRVTAV